MADLPYHCPISMLLAAASTGSDETRDNTPDPSTTSPTQLDVPFDDLIVPEANGRFSPDRYSPISRSPPTFIDSTEYAFPLSNNYHHQIMQHQQQQMHQNQQQQLHQQMLHHSGNMIGLHHQLQQNQLAANLHLHQHAYPHHQMLPSSQHMGMQMQHHYIGHMPEHLQAGGSPPKKMRKRSEPDASMEYHSTEDGRGYTCDFKGCGRRFERLHNLKSHYTTHTGERPYPCDACDKAFGRSHDLRRHQRIHTDSKPYACHSCGKRFARNDALTRHQRANGNGGCRTRNRKLRGPKGQDADDDDEDEDDDANENTFMQNAVHSTMMHMPHSTVADQLNYEHAGVDNGHFKRDGSY